MSEFDSIKIESIWHNDQTSGLYVYCTRCRTATGAWLGLWAADDASITLAELMSIARKHDSESHEGELT